MDISSVPYTHILPPDKKHLWNRYPIDPDRELLEWEQWVRVRNEEITILSKNTEKQPPDLVMNLHEKRREDQEWKTVIEHAQIQTKAKIRGKTLWERPVRLKQECYNDPIYEVHRTPAEKGKPPIIEHIGVPKEILKTEKGLVGESDYKTDKQIDAQFKKYKAKREQELAENIKKIDPYKSEIGKLIVKGHRPKPPPPPPPVLPLISVTQYIHTPKFYASYDALRINNSFFYQSVPTQIKHYMKKLKDTFNDPCTSWYYYFNTPMIRAAKGSITLENFGTTAIRYFWVKVKRAIPFLPEDTTEQVFFFNKNEDVIFPGQTKKVTFTFMTENPGIYSEFWELCISNATLIENPKETFLVNLYGDSIENTDDIISSILDFNHYIKTIKKRHYFNRILNNLIDKITTVEPQTYPYQKMLLEEEIFVLKNPICFYHQTQVGKLKTYYQEMEPGKEWDLSIVTWRSVMVEKPFEDRMKYYELLKESHRDLLKPWYEDCDLRKQKHDAVKMLLGNLVSKMDEEYSRLFEIVLAACPRKTGSKKSALRINIEKTPVEIKNIFYMKVYGHLSDTIETCAGVISSIDLSRWIDFDFCRFCRCNY